MGVEPGGQGAGVCGQDAVVGGGVVGPYPGQGAGVEPVDGQANWSTDH
jgi:hypothetical protein